MKKLLLSLFLLSIGMMTNVNAQATCASAITLTTNGTYTTGTINGTYKVACFPIFATPKGYWYKFTPTTNGEISISSNLATNNGVTKSNDTRVSIATGLCAGTLTCVDGNDDVDDVNYLSELLNVPVVAGTTYLIQWDSRWSALPLDFTFTFTAIACARPTVFYLPEYSSTSSTDLYWDQTAPAPAEYEVDWSNDFVVPAGSGTLVTVPAGALAYSTANIADIPASTNFRFYTVITSWQQEILKYWKPQTITKLRREFTSNLTMLVASDGGYNNGKGSFGVVIANQDSVITDMEGDAPRGS